MLAADRDALACDLWETYQIRDMEALPAKDLAMLSCGLRDDARINMILSGRKLRIETTLLAGCFDLLASIKWDLGGKKGNPPESMLKLITGVEASKNDNDIVSFNTAEEWEAERARILRG